MNGLERAQARLLQARADVEAVMAAPQEGVDMATALHLAAVNLLDAEQDVIDWRRPSDD